MLVHGQVPQQRFRLVSRLFQYAELVPVVLFELKLVLASELALVL